jgi:pimeloyl-ACP methyl ester carboxylesterase
LSPLADTDRSCKPPLVFIHGLIGDLRDCAAAEAFLSRTTLAPDLLGYGSHQDIAPESITITAQVDLVRSCIDDAFPDRSVDVLGHSVGGVIGVLLARRYPGLVRRFVSAEGNFTLNDAFWSASVGRMAPPVADDMLNGFRGEPAAWLEKSCVSPTSSNITVATSWLSRQPASTLQRMGQSVVTTTAAEDYLRDVACVFRTIPVLLIAGSRSRSGWDVPEWAERSAFAFEVMEGCGHMMMLENRELFARSVVRFLDLPLDGPSQPTD